MSAPAPGPYGSHKCGCTIAKLGPFIDIERCDLHRAAPDLLAACEAAVEELRGDENYVGDNGGEADFLADLRAAIAKAKGGT